MPAIEEPDPQKVYASGGLTSYGVVQLIINQLLGGLRKPDLEILASFVNHRLANFPCHWKKDFATIEDVFTLWEKVALEQGNTVSVIKKLRDRTGWGLREAKEATDAYKAALAKKEIDPLTREIPLWMDEDEDPNDCITAKERRLIFEQMLKGDSTWALMNPEGIDQIAQCECLNSIRERHQSSSWSLIDAKMLFDAVARDIRAGKISKPAVQLVEEPEPEDLDAAIRSGEIEGVIEFKELDGQLLE